MRVLERYDVLGHEVNIQMDSTSSDLQVFSCLMTVDNNKARISNCSFNDGEKLNPEKVLKEAIEESLSYAKSPNLGKFIKDGNFDGSEQEINAGDMLFRAVKNSHTWMMNNFTKAEIKELYKAIEPDLDLDSISKEVFYNNYIFGFNTSTKVENVSNSFEENNEGRFTNEESEDNELDLD